VGHPVIDRYRHRTFASPSNDQRLLLLLPGSRRSEIERHVPILLGATRLIREKAPQLQIRMVLPNESMAALANRYLSNSDGISVQAGGLAESLSIATAAIASTGTVTIECAYFGVPTVAMYVVSGATYQIGKRLIKVPYLAMPNLLGREVIFPELIQEAASPQNIAREALELVSDATRRITIKNRLQQVIAALGPPGAADRAAAEIFALLAPQVGRSLPK
jgi:lipid-A-disaccharide synthase